MSAGTVSKLVGQRAEKIAPLALKKVASRERGCFPHFSLVVVNSEVLSVTFHRGESTHGDTADGV